MMETVIPGKEGKEVGTETEFAGSWRHSSGTGLALMQTGCFSQHFVMKPLAGHATLPDVRHIWRNTPVLGVCDGDVF